jgi:hypothetical protein
MLLGIHRRKASPALTTPAAARIVVLAIAIAAA